MLTACGTQTIRPSARPFRHDPQILSLSFNVEANNGDDALKRALASVDDLRGRLALPGHLRRLRGYTDEGWIEAELGQ